LKLGGYIEMSNNPRNSRFQRKSGKNAHKSDSKQESSGPPRRAYGMRSHGAVSKPKKRSGSSREGGAGWIWGLHAVKAALANPKRTIHTIIMTEKAQSRISLPDNAPLPEIVMPQVLDKQFGDGAAHQGIAIKAAPLEWPDIETLATEESDQDGLILVLDQITDPHNVGAMLRLASAFGVRALVMQDRKAPPMSGAMAKVAVGCLETVPVCLVTNVANTLLSLRKLGWMVTGLAGDTNLELSTALSDGNQVIVMGAEGPGLRPRVRDCCDQLARIPMLSSNVVGQAESLNVATAAGIALYEARRGQ